MFLPSMQRTQRYCRCLILNNIHFNLTNGVGYYWIGNVFYIHRLKLLNQSLCTVIVGSTTTTTANLNLSQLHPIELPLYIYKIETQVERSTVCPISKSEMVNPVKHIPCGHVYDKVEYLRICIIQRISCSVPCGHVYDKIEYLRICIIQRISCSIPCGHVYDKIEYIRICIIQRISCSIPEGGKAKQP